MMEGSHGRVLQRCKCVNKTPEASPRSLSLGDTMQFTKYAEMPSLKKKTHTAGLGQAQGSLLLCQAGAKQVGKISFQPKPQTKFPVES